MNMVKNLNGTAGKRCSCPGSNSWLAHWEQRAGHKANMCASCTSPAEVGGHVKKVGHDYSHYIVPLCKACNQRTDVFLVYEELVSAICD